MPKVLVTHEVDDVAHWLASGKRAEVFGTVVSDIRTFVDPESPNRVGLSMDVPDMDVSSCDGKSGRRRSNEVRRSQARNARLPDRELTAVSAIQGPTLTVAPWCDGLVDGVGQVGAELSRGHDPMMGQVEDRTTRDPAFLYGTRPHASDRPDDADSSGHRSAPRTTSATSRARSSATPRHHPRCRPGGAKTSRPIVAPFELRSLFGRRNPC
jgi:hypothetical protein